MAQAAVLRKHHYGGSTFSARTFNNELDVAKPRLGLKFPGLDPVYVPLVDPSDPNAAPHSKRRIQGSTYCFGKNAFYEPGLTGLTRHYCYLQSGTSSTWYYNYYYFRLADEFRSGSPSSASTTTDSYLESLLYAGGGGTSAIVIYGWNTGTLTWDVLVSSSYSRTLLQGAGSTTRRWYWHASTFDGYSDFKIRIGAEQYSSHTMHIVLRNETLAVGNEIKSFCQGTGEYGDSGLTVAGKDDSDETLCGRVINVSGTDPNVVQSGDAVRVYFDTNMLSKRGGSTWYQFVQVGDPVVFGAHGGSVAPNVGQRVSYVSAVNYPAAGSESGGWVELMADSAGTVPLTLVSAGFGVETSIWRLDIGDRVVA